MSQVHFSHSPQRQRFIDRRIQETRKKKEDNNSIHRNEALLSDKSNFASSRGRNSRRGGQKFGHTESFRQRDRQGPNQGLRQGFQ